MISNRDVFARMISGHEHLLMMALRLSLGIIFTWFGILKVFGYNPVFDVIYHSMAPFLASGLGLIVLGSFEALLGILLIYNRFLDLTHLLLMLHLIGTFSTFIFGFEIIFEPRFPILSLAGEFVIKNLILLLAGLAVLVHESRRAYGRT
jgi:putative oxidoreductase